MTADSGIYLIMIDRYFYYGRAKNLRARKYVHLSDLRAGKHGNSHMQRAWDKYGVLSFSVVCYAPESVIDKLEACYVSHYVGDPLCMNMSIPDGTGHWSHSEESRRKMSLRATGRKMSHQAIENRLRTMANYRMSDEAKENVRRSLMSRCRFVNEKGMRVWFDSVADAAEFFGLSVTSISDRLRGKVGWVEVGIDHPMSGWVGERVVEESRNKRPGISAAKSKPCVFYGPRGEEFHFPSCKIAAEYFGIANTSTNKRLNGQIGWPKRKDPRCPMIGWTGSWYNQTLVA